MTKEEWVRAEDNCIVCGKKLRTKRWMIGYNNATDSIMPASDLTGCDDGGWYIGSDCMRMYPKSWRVDVTHNE
tara:strand:+ start:798 stop:1016 length:219 start_codon:yes stop_codon:yes gene_type:complete